MKRSPLAFPALILGLTLTTSLASQAPTYTPFGKGCPGTAGIPVLRAAGNDLPILGRRFTAEVGNLPFLASGIGITGLSKTFWGRTRLPFDLTFLAMPGCLLYTDPRQTRTLVINRGLGFWDTTIPNDSGLIGVHFYQQALVLDRVPGLGAIMSNAAEGVIGLLPDLEMTSGTPTVTPPTIPAGSTVTMSSFTVRNSGNGAAGTFQTAYYLSTDSIITSTDQFLLALGYPAMAPFASVTAIPRNLTIPASTAPGSYWIGMLADRTHVIAESNENNNYVRTALTVTAALPDLYVSSGNPALSPTTVEAGRTVNISAVTIRNQGAGTAGSCSVGYYLSTNSTITTSDRFLTSVGIGSLTPGSSFTIASRNLTIPVTVSASGYYVGILVDRTGAVPESNEGNNTAARALTVTAARPDLFVSSGMPSVIPSVMVRPFFFVPAPFELGGFTVRNSGLVASGPFIIGFYFSTNNIISTGDHLMGEVFVGNIPAGSSVNIPNRLLWTSSGPPGDYWVGVMVDSRGQVTESNEGNNVVKTKVLVIN